MINVEGSFLAPNRYDSFPVYLHLTPSLAPNITPQESLVEWKVKGLEVRWQCELAIVLKNWGSLLLMYSSWMSSKKIQRSRVLA